MCNQTALHPWSCVNKQLYTSPLRPIMLITDSEFWGVSAWASYCSQQMNVPKWTTPSHMHAAPWIRLHQSHPPNSITRWKAVIFLELIVLYRHTHIWLASQSWAGRTEMTNFTTSNTNSSSDQCVYLIIWHNSTQSWPQSK